MGSQGKAGINTNLGPFVFVSQERKDVRFDCISFFWSVVQVLMWSLVGKSSAGKQMNVASHQNALNILSKSEI